MLGYISQWIKKAVATARLEPTPRNIWHSGFAFESSALPTELSRNQRRWVYSRYMKYIQCKFITTKERVYVIIYTNGKKKRCSVKMLIIHKICGGWAWKFINMVSLIHTFTYQTFTRFHVCLVRHLIFLWKLHFMSSVTEKQYATKLIDAKRKFMELMIRKPLYFC